MGQTAADGGAPPRDPTRCREIAVVVWQLIREIIFALALLLRWLLSRISYPDWAPQWPSRRRETAIAIRFINLVFSDLAAAHIIKKLKHEQPAVDLAQWRDKYNDGLLHLAVRAKRVDLIAMLTKEGCDLEARWGRMASPFLHACANGSLAVVDALLSSRPDYPHGPQMRLPCAPSPLQVACDRDNRELYLYLLRKGARASPRQLRHAIITDDAASVQVMTSGASWLTGKGGGSLGMFRSTYSLSPLEYAIIMRKHQVAPLLAINIMLLVRKQQWQVVRRVVEWRHAEALKAIWQAGWRCDDAKKGTPLLITAVTANDFHLVMYLLYAGVGVPNSRMAVPGEWWRLWRRTTLLHLACNKANVEIVAALLVFGGDMNARDSGGQTVLAHALNRTNVLSSYHLAALSGSKYKYSKQGKAARAREVQYHEFLREQLPYLIAQAALQGRRSDALTEHEASLIQRHTSAALPRMSQSPEKRRDAQPIPQPPVGQPEGAGDSSAQPTPMTAPTPVETVNVPVNPTAEKAPIAQAPASTPQHDARETPAPGPVTETPVTVPPAPEPVDPEEERERLHMEKAAKRKARREREKANRERARKEAEELRQRQAAAEQERLAKLRAREEKELAERLAAAAAEPPPEVVIDPRYAHLYCPLSKELMTDAVLAGDGLTYQRSMLKEYIQKCYESQTSYASPISDTRIDVIICANRAISAEAQQRESALLLAEVA